MDHFLGQQVHRERGAGGCSKHAITYLNYTALWQRLGRSPYATATFVAMRTQGNYGRKLLPRALLHKAVGFAEISRSLVRYAVNCRSKRARYLAPLIPVWSQRVCVGRTPTWVTFMVHSCNCTLSVGSNLDTTIYVEGRVPDVEAGNLRNRFPRIDVISNGHSIARWISEHGHCGFDVESIKQAQSSVESSPDTRREVFLRSLAIRLSRSFDRAGRQQRCYSENSDFHSFPRSAWTGRSRPFLYRPSLAGLERRAA